jgi:hypothetical protein
LYVQVAYVGVVLSVRRRLGGVEYSFVFSQEHSDVLLMWAGGFLAVGLGLFIKKRNELFNFRCQALWKSRMNRYPWEDRYRPNSDLHKHYQFEKRLARICGPATRVQEMPLVP